MATVNGNTISTTSPGGYGGWYAQMTYDSVQETDTSYSLRVTKICVLANKKNPPAGYAGEWYGFAWDSSTGDTHSTVSVSLTGATTQTNKPKSASSTRDSGKYTTYTWTFNKTYTWSKGHTEQTKSVVGKVAVNSCEYGIADLIWEYLGNVASTATLIATVPALESWTVTLTYPDGGTGDTSATKWYGEDLTLPTPTKTGYRFAGWTDGNNTYDSTHPYTANAAATLSATWTPVISAIYITNLTAKRATDTGVPADDGTWVLIEPEWRVEGAATGNITVAATMDSTPAYSDSETVSKSTTANVDSSDLANPPSFLADGAATNQRYTVTVTVSCGGETATRSVILPTAYFVMDVKAGGHGIAFGTPANTDYLFEVDNMDVRLGQDLSVAGSVYAATSTPLVPVGTILDFAGATAPTGYLVCDGSAVPRTTYAALFSVIGTTWGTGDGSTTFNIPDFRGRTSIGVGTGTATDATAHTLGSTGGEEKHTLTVPELAEHAHRPTTTDGWSFQGIYPESNVTGSYNLQAHSSGSNRYTFASTATSKFTYWSWTATRGESDPHNTMQPFAVVTKIIRAV